MCFGLFIFSVVNYVELVFCDLRDRRPVFGCIIMPGGGARWLPGRQGARVVGDLVLFNTSGQEPQQKVVWELLNWEGFLFS